MPRKKKTEETISATVPAPEPRLEETPPANPPLRRKKAVELPSEGVVSAVPTPAQEEKAAPARKKAKALPSAATEAAKPAEAEKAKPVKRKAKADSEAATAPESKAKTPRKAKPSLEAPPAEAVPAEPPAAEEAQPKAARVKKGKGKPAPEPDASSASPDPVAEAVEEPRDFVALEDVLSAPDLAATFRPRKPLPRALGADSEVMTQEVEEPVTAPILLESTEEEEGMPYAALTFSFRGRDGAGRKGSRLRQERRPEPPQVEAPTTNPAPSVPATAPRQETVEAAAPEASAPQAAPLPPPRDLGDEELRDLFVAVWRQPGAGPAPQSESEQRDEFPVFADGEQESDSSEPSFGRRRRRRRGRRDDGQESEEPQAAAAPAEAIEDQAEAPAKPVAAKAKPEPKPRIPVPVDAPQVVLRNGSPTLVINKKVVAPLFFTVGRLEPKSEQAVLEQVKMAAEQGIHLFGLTVRLEPSDEGPAVARHEVDRFWKLISDAAPEAKILVRVEFAPIPVPTARGWNQEVGHPSLASDAYWSEAGQALAELCRSLEGLPILGFHLERDSWHFGPDEGFEDNSEARSRFGKWLRHRYGNDVISLRASWFDGKVTFDHVGIPDFRYRHGSDTDFVRLDRRARRWVDYHLFLSDLMVERIFDLARTVKEVSQGRHLVGVSYGYTFEWSHPGSGHLSLGKLLRCPEVDYVAGPPSYKSREPGGSGAFPWPIDSFALSSKLALSEEDFRTSIGRGDGSQDNPLMKTPQALESAHWRGVGSVLAHGGGLNWMDRESQGWLGSRGIWERGRKVCSSLQWRSSTPLKDPDIAVLVDERSLAYLADERAFTELIQDVRESVLRSGLSVGFYLLSDLAHRETFPEAKVHVFVNAWDIRPEVRSAIKSRLQRDNKVLLWLYSAGLFEGGRESLVRAREVTGIALRPQPFNSRSGTSLLNVRDPLCRVLPDDAIAQGGSLEPSYFAIPEDAAVLGEYTQTGLPSFVVQKFPKQGTSDDPWTSIFLGEPVVSPGLFRALGQMAGAHVWCLDDDVLHVRAPFLTIHCRGAGVRTLNLPDKWSCYDLIQGVWMPVENANLKFLGLDGATHCYLVGHKSEIEAILSAAPASVLSEEEILAHQDNTIRWDSIQFDVPIMKLDEWVEESWDPEMAEDLLIKPSLIDEIEEPSEEPGETGSDRQPRSRSRRERKGRKQKNSAGRPDPGQKRQEEVQTLNFLFRKRE